MKELTIDELGVLLAEYYGIKEHEIKEAEGDLDYFLELTNKETGKTDVFCFTPVEDKQYIECIYYPNPVLVQGVQGERICSLYTVYTKNKQQVGVCVEWKGENIIIN